MEKSGKFIVLEGGEGAGKGVVIADLHQRLVGRDDVIFTREPGGTTISEKIRLVLLSKDNSAMLPLTELFLFCGARAQHVEEKIRLALEKGSIVISDRFDASTIAYQIFGRRRAQYLKVFEVLNKIAKAGLEPDAVIYLDVNPRVGLERKRKSQDGLCTRFDEEEEDFHRRVREGYVAQCSRATRKEKGSVPVWHFVPTSEFSEKEVKEKVWEIVKKILEME